mmetsp:Transcript_90356/g.156505  ORF Transcript_90356/g.156505 Transcript_90356/m.156505 type:complete len:264 (+) Transcript_90356:1932-2723(+)
MSRASSSFSTAMVLAWDSASRRDASSSDVRSHRLWTVSSSRAVRAMVASLLAVMWLVSVFCNSDTCPEVVCCSLWYPAMVALSSPVVVSRVCTWDSETSSRWRVKRRSASMTPSCERSSSRSLISACFMSSVLVKVWLLSFSCWLSASTSCCRRSCACSSSLCSACCCPECSRCMLASSSVVANNFCSNSTKRCCCSCIFSVQASRLRSAAFRLKISTSQSCWYGRWAGGRAECCCSDGPRCLTGYLPSGNPDGELRYCLALP